MSDLETAIGLACRVHLGQRDKAGQAYILHPLRLMLKLPNEDERIAAVLHDVVEDGDVSLDDLRQMGFAAPVVDAIDCLSRRPEETYEQFIGRIALNSLATRVKMEDLKDNMDLTRLGLVEDKDLERIGKYHRALMYLRERDI
jgi:(p)ppGpp synthase/HD superfamily hydrolase